MSADGVTLAERVTMTRITTEDIETVETSWLLSVMKRNIAFAPTGTSLIS